MGTTYLHAVASLDGYIADERDDVGPLHDWYFSGDHPLVDEDHADVHGALCRVSAASADYVRGMWSRQKVLVSGAQLLTTQQRVANHGYRDPSGEYMGIPATGKSVTYNEIFIFRFVNGRIAETLGVVDVFAQLKQLSVIPAQRSTPTELGPSPGRDELLRSDRSVPPGTP
jgi:SnoaL-like polyketide cyclase